MGNGKMKVLESHGIYTEIMRPPGDQLVTSFHKVTS